jgi:hypothetical protein
MKAGDDLADDQVLTQYGTTTQPWRTAPRMRDRGAVSLIMGNLTGPVAGAVVRANGPYGDGTDAARTTTAGTLRAHGFRPSHSPSKGNPLHVSVAAEREWDEDAFDRCFGEPQVAPPPADIKR